MDIPPYTHIIVYSNPQSHLSILSHHTRWDRWDCPVDVLPYTHIIVYSNPQSHLSILSHCTRWDCPVDCTLWDRWDVPWTSLESTSTLNPTCPSYPAVPCGIGGMSHGHPTYTTAHPYILFSYILFSMLSFCSLRYEITANSTDKRCRDMVTCVVLSGLHTAIPILSFCGFWHCHPYIPLHS